jgi:hypothetical protein
MNDDLIARNVPIDPVLCRSWSRHCPPRLHKLKKRPARKRVKVEGKEGYVSHLSRQYVVTCPLITSNHISVLDLGCYHGV